MSISKLRARLNVPPPSEAAAPSLPPVPGETLSPTPTTPATPVTKKDGNLIGKSSLMRKKAVAIVAMRATGMTTEEIAAELGIKPGSVHSYVYRAAKSGFLVNKRGESLLDDPKDRVEFELAHKAVRNMNEFLDSDNDEVRERMTLEIAKGALFKKFDPQPTAPSMGVQALAIKIEMPTTGGMAVREGTIGGVPNYVEGEVAGEKGKRD